MNILVIFIALIAIVHGAVMPVAGQRYCYVILSTNPDRQQLPEDVVKGLTEAHLANIDRLALEGKLLVAGPFEGGGGVFIMNSGDTAKVREWLDTDPGIHSRRWNIEVFPFEPVTGQVCRGDTSAQMVTYTWVRFRHATTAPEVIEAHRRYINDLFESGAVISEGTFAGEQGRILVLRGASDGIIQKDPLVVQGAVPYDLRTWWVAEGSFCERSQEH